MFLGNYEYNVFLTRVLTFCSSRIVNLMSFYLNVIYRAKMFVIRRKYFNEILNRNASIIHGKYSKSISLL